MAYIPSEVARMRTPFKLLAPVSKKAYGVATKAEWREVDGIIFANCKTYGGTEKVDNNILSIEDTASLVCRYRKDITSDKRLLRLTDNAVFEILGEPENLEIGNRVMKLKIRRVKGGV